VGEEVKSLSLV